MARAYDMAIIGAGMAGASLAARLVARAPALRIALIEAETRPGYHATGRSAAFWTQSYGGPGVVPLTLASGAELARRGVLRRRGGLTIGLAGREGDLDGFVARFAGLDITMQRLGRDAIAAHVPGLRPAWVAGVWEPDCCDIDVAALHQQYLAEARRGGVDLRCMAGLRRAARGAEGWRLGLADGAVLTAGVLVNAGGAWADEVAALAGAGKLGIAPLRRTMVQARTLPAAPDTLPLVLDIDAKFYFKPDAGRLWLTPHDETPSPPCDVAPEEVDVARGVAQIEAVVDWRIERIDARWAGLRSFAPDRLPVYGFDAGVPGFFWFAGQGGFGIQTAPAAADLAARLLLGEGPGLVSPGLYAPQRFAGRVG